MAFAFEQNAQRFKHIALIVRNQNPAHFEFSIVR
jgi:hypothetical protein